MDGNSIIESNSPRRSPTIGHKSPSNNNESGLLAVGRVLRRENSRKDATTSPILTPTSRRKVFRSWSTDDSTQHTAPPSLRKGGSKAMYAWNIVPQKDQNLVNNHGPTPNGPLWLPPMRITTTTITAAAVATITTTTTKETLATWIF